MKMVTRSLIVIRNDCQRERRNGTKSDIIHFIFTNNNRIIIDGDVSDGICYDISNCIKKCIICNVFVINNPTLYLINNHNNLGNDIN